MVAGAVGMVSVVRTADAFSGDVQTHLSLLHKSLKNGEASSKLIMEWIIRNSLENVSV